MGLLLTPRLVSPEPAPATRTPVTADAPPTPGLDAGRDASRMHRDPSLSCILPCRNEAENLDRLLPRLLDEISALVNDWEVIIVDDGSTDATLEVLTRWSMHDGMRAIQLSRNFGKEAALTAGLQAARGQVVLMMDADLQHEPELIPALLQKWREGADTAYALRQRRDDESLLKRLGSRGFYALVNAADRFEVPAGAGDFRLMDRRVVDALLALPERNRFMKGLYAWVGFTSVAVPYMPAPRVNGRSHFSALRLMRLSLDGLTAFTTWPLRAVSVVGFVLAMLAFVYGAYLTLEYLLYGHDVSGWTTIVVSLMLFAGIQLGSLGVVGEYVGRIFEEAKGRPLFIVKREFGNGLKTSRQ